ncbi:MAG TPA: PAS domain-containing sensor histidine kinase [Anaerolineae bacterium]|nr:PAS domain-containing sensor histidine kinase [Anaerolineae bacterium]
MQPRTPAVETTSRPAGTPQPAGVSSSTQFEGALRDSEERHSQLFENQQTVMLIYDPQTFDIVDANPAACQFYGYSRAQLTAMKITDLNGLSLEQAAQALQESRQTQRQPYVLKHRLANGEVRDVEAYAGPIEVRGKTYQYSIVHDITRRKQVEDDLRRERNFVSAVLDTVGALVVVLDRAGRIVRFNRACERLTSYTFAEVKDRCLWDIFLIPEELAAVKNVFERLRAGDFPLDFENYWVTKDSRRRLIAWSNTVLVADDGTIEHVIGTGVDITGRRQAEQEIRHMSSFPLLNPNPVLEVDATGQVIFCNPGTLKVLEQIGLRPDAQLFIPTDWSTIMRELEQQPASLARREVAVGTLMFAESIYFAPGFGTIRIFATDITERKQVEARLRQNNAELQARNAELDAFAHSVAHDIKNPLHIIGGHAELLTMDFDKWPAEAVLDSLRSIQRNVRKINSITDNLMLLSEVRQKAIVLQPLDMASILDEVWPRVAHLMDGQIEVKVPTAWPIALGYAPWVEQVWVNYLTNALKYANRPGCVKLGAAPLLDGLSRFWVRDDGVGIAPDEQAHLFTAFYRTAHTRRGGHGLGLSIVKRIVERLGGTVGVESSGVPGEGSTFSFTLPAA